MMATRAKFGDSKAEIFAELEVNDDARVTGILRAAQLRSDGIVQVGSSPPAGVDLAVGGSIGATGNISTSAALRTNTLTAVSGSVVTASGDLTVVGTTRCDVLRGQAGTQVTCDDDFSVDGDLTVSGNVASAGQVAAQTMFCLGSLTVNGGILGWLPFFCAGYVDGSDLSTLSSRGVTFTVSRNSFYPVGVYQVTFASPHPAGNNYIVLLHSRNSNSYLTPTAIQNIPVSQTSNFFHVTLRNVGATATVNEQFHFMVLH
jgi:hypothetical protein